MRDPELLYTVDEDLAAEIRRGAEPTLVHLLRGFVDAGSAGQLAADHLTAQLGPRRLVTFDVDELLDYRSRRPTMTFDASRWSDYEEPFLAIDVLKDVEGVPFLLLHGSEPDVRWESWVAAVHQIVERFAVPLTVGAHGIPMGVPHTRPIAVTSHATRAELVGGHPSWFGTVQVPASASALLEYRLGGWGHDALGFAVHVPHYVSQSGYPRAALAALEHVERATGLELGSGLLEPAAAETTAEIDAQVSASAEIGAIVHALEEQYDAYTGSGARPSLLSADIPTADELGAEFERFLAQQDGDSTGS